MIMPNDVYYALERLLIAARLENLCADDVLKVTAWLGTQPDDLLNTIILDSWRDGDPSLLEVYQTGYLDGMHSPHATIALDPEWSQAKEWAHFAAPYLSCEFANGIRLRWLFYENEPVWNGAWRRVSGRWGDTAMTESNTVSVENLIGIDQMLRRRLEDAE